MDYERRLAKVRSAISARGLKVAILTSWESLYYLTGMKPIQSRSSSRDPMPLLVSPDRKEPIFVPTAAFSQAAKIEHKNVKDIRPYDGPEMWTQVSEIIRDLDARNGAIGLESRYISYQHYLTLAGKIRNKSMEDCSDIVEELRMVKDAEELGHIRKACTITDKVVARVGESCLKPGVTELQIAGEIIRAAIEFGSEGESFHPQVFSGRRGYLLNISSSTKKIEKRDVVMLDFGVNVNGYRTDTTRCFVLGKATEKQKEASKIALEITENAVDSIKPGVKASTVHKNVLADYKKFGYEGYCRHYTGHGIGLSTWERPLLREFDHTTIKQNMTLAVEQGLYFPKFGVRYEENLIVTKKGVKSLFKYPTGLVEI